jgi:HNH endonuclease
MRHYERWHNHGDPLAGGPARDVPWADRFWAKVDAEGDCWEWMGTRKKNGYGTFGPPPGLSTRHVHRLAYEYLVGPIPDGLVIDHLCRVRHCVNPDHMEATTQSVNILRGAGPALAPYRDYSQRVKQPACRNGHLYTENNTWHSKRGARVCKTCHKAAMARWHAKRQQ